MLWLAGFLFLAFKGATVAPPANSAFFALAALGSAWFAAFDRARVRELWREHRGLLATVLLLAAAILFSEAVAKARGEAPAHPLPPQAGLLLCLPALALFLRDERALRAVVLVFAAVCLWHLVAMPLEAVLGVKVSWHRIELLPRDAGPLHFQASGLAWQAYYFPGLFLPLFWLAWGPVYERRVFPGWPLSPRAMLVLPLLWLVPALSVQSRSAFAGALTAALLAIVGASRAKRLRTWFAVGLLAIFAAAVYWHLFAENKSGADLRVAYFKHYVRAAMDWHWLATGRSYYLDPDLRMMVPGMQMLQHSHNDIAQVFYSWGLPGLLAYLAFWVALVRLVWTRFARHGEYWPACALIALLPNMVTDLGFQHYEKAAFLVLLTAFCLACAGRPRPARAAAPDQAGAAAAPVRP
ncbi:O-antigen ligase family protein [Ramlibacter sp.]|uniref:O-antigen ligase family protein n=1 Tax=Ramlibacter sp. TaxID=1917967 RepID=UPI002C251B75|nr:O-antigen ligase family protein [Ramlibacter sp.]HWI84179.1 O-antigen ligase family protein [Ramlibacter sp.]